MILICVWAAVVVFGFFILNPPLPILLGIVGGLLGVEAGILQHLSISQNKDVFLSTFSFMEVRSGFTSNWLGRTYIGSVYASKIVLAILAFTLVKAPLHRVLLGYVVAYVSFMLTRDILTLRDTFALGRLKDRSAG